MNLSNAEDRARMLELNLDLEPPRISEIVLKTSRYDALRAWYQGVLGLAPFYEYVPSGPARPREPGEQERASDIRLTFFRLHLSHPYVQVVALFDIAGLRDGPTGDPGLHHMQFRNASMDDLFKRYERLAALDIRPHRTANHGPGTSFYYRDPDGNIVELSAANFETQEAYMAYFKSESYRRNPSGIEIDADAYIARYRTGVPLDELVRIPA
jgi:catechol 2,3-dioxygenase-like lactoylglutathione lyase family enzyme